MTDDVRSDARALADLLAAPSRVVALTGAGASAASGVPTYRGAGGTWTRYDPSKYASIDTFRQDPAYYWQFFRDERYPTLQRARPNPVHDALARLERQGKLSAIATQNIDGLHQAAGSQRVLELHGNTRRFHCESCRGTLQVDEVRARLDLALPPDCPACGEKCLRPGVVMFGESLPEEVLREAVGEMQSTAVVVVVGSSLVVEPAASLPVLATRSGARLAILNIDPTPLDSIASLIVRSPADQVLPAAVALLEHSAPPS